MVLDEDALEAMLRRQNAANPHRSKDVTLTDETDEFEVYERSSKEPEPAEEPPEPVHAEPQSFFEGRVDDVPVPGFVPEPLDVEPEPEPAPEPVRAPVPEPSLHNPTPAPPVEERPRTHSPTPHNFAPPPAPSRDGDGPRVAIVQALFNQELTDMMAELAKAKVTKLGGTLAQLATVPGVYDLPLLTQTLLARDDVDCAVVLGVVVTGETKHDELITHATAHTLQRVSLETGKPIGLGISGPGMTWTQAEARVANGAHAVEAAVAQWQALRTA